MESAPTIPRPDTPVAPPISEAAPTVSALAPTPSEIQTATVSVAEPTMARTTDALPSTPPREIPLPEKPIPLNELMLAEISALEEKNALRYEGALCFALGEDSSRTLVFPEPITTGSDEQHPQTAEYLAMTPGGFKLLQFYVGSHTGLQQDVRLVMESCAMGNHDYFDRSNTPTGYQNDADHGESVTFSPNIFMRERRNSGNWGAGKLVTSVDPTRTRQFIEANKKRANEIVAYRKRDREEQHKRQDTWNRQSVAMLEELI